MMLSVVVSVVRIVFTLAVVDDDRASVAVHKLFGVMECCEDPRRSRSFLAILCDLLNLAHALSCRRRGSCHA